MSSLLENLSEGLKETIEHEKGNRGSTNRGKEPAL